MDYIDEVINMVHENIQFAEQHEFPEQEKEGQVPGSQGQRGKIMSDEESKDLDEEIAVYDVQDDTEEKAPLNPKAGVESVAEGYQLSARRPGRSAAGIGNHHKAVAEGTGAVEKNRGVIQEKWIVFVLLMGIIGYILR